MIYLQYKIYKLDNYVPLFLHDLESENFVCLFINIYDKTVNLLNKNFFHCNKGEKVHITY